MAEDLRPPVAIGHIALGVPDVDASKAFFLAIGMRDVEPGAPVAILELRGGTHLILLPSDGPTPEGGVAPFDLMVDDIDATHAAWRAAGLSPSDVGETSFHRSFTVQEPGGHAITVLSTHATGLPI